MTSCLTSLRTRELFSITVLTRLFTDCAAIQEWRGDARGICLLILFLLFATAIKRWGFTPCLGKKQRDVVPKSDFWKILSIKSRMENWDLFWDQRNCSKTINNRDYIVADQEQRAHPRPCGSRDFPENHLSHSCSKRKWRALCSILEKRRRRRDDLTVSRSTHSTHAILVHTDE